MTQAARCTGSNAVRPIEEPGAWVNETTTECAVCHHHIQIKVRGFDRPPNARILPHRTDGTPTR